MKSSIGSFNFGIAWCALFCIPVVQGLSSRTVPQPPEDSCTHEHCSSAQLFSSACRRHIQPRRRTRRTAVKTSNRAPRPTAIRQDRGEAITTAPSPAAPILAAAVLSPTDRARAALNPIVLSPVGRTPAAHSPAGRSLVVRIKAVRRNGDIARLTGRPIASAAMTAPICIAIT